MRMFCLFMNMIWTKPELLILKVSPFSWVALGAVKFCPASDFSLILKSRFKLFQKDWRFQASVWCASDADVQLKLSPPCPAAEPLSQSVSADKAPQISAALWFPQTLQEGSLRNVEHSPCWWKLRGTEEEANTVLSVLTTVNIWIWVISGEPEIHTSITLFVCRRHERLCFCSTQDMDKVAPRRCLAAVRRVTQRYITCKVCFIKVNNKNMTQYKQIESQIRHEVEDCDSCDCLHAKPDANIWRLWTLSLKNKIVCFTGKYLKSFISN